MGHNGNLITLSCAVNTATFAEITSDQADVVLSTQLNHNLWLRSNSSQVKLGSWPSTSRHNAINRYKRSCVCRGIVHYRRSNIKEECISDEVHNSTITWNYCCDYSFLPKPAL